MHGSQPSVNGYSLSDVDRAAPDQPCDGCGDPAEMAVEWESDDTGGRYWRNYCRPCGDAELAPFSVPGYPWVPLLFVAVYTTLLVGTVRAQPKLVAGALAMLVVAYGGSWAAVGGNGRQKAAGAP